MREGHFAAHIRRTRLLLRDQRDLLIDRLRQRLGADMLFEAPDQGMHFVAYLAEALSDIEAARTARRYRVSVRALSPMYRRSPPRSGLLIGFAGHPCRTIPAAVSRLGEAFREVARSHPAHVVDASGQLKGVDQEKFARRDRWSGVAPAARRAQWTARVD
jgi:GntR family transcriptional regulator/MocR family aminotransferase